MERSNAKVAQVSEVLRFVSRKQGCDKRALLPASIKSKCPTQGSSRQIEEERLFMGLLGRRTW
jgi:hypothetical protein